MTVVQRALFFTYRTGRRVGIAVVGGTVLLAGLAMIVLPGAAVIAIPAGLGILALEFEWAKRWLDVARQHSRALVARWRGRD